MSPSTAPGGPRRIMRSARLGTVPYREALARMEALAEARREGAIDDTLLLLEHEPVYTVGRRGSEEELPMGRDAYEQRGIEVVEVDRGGGVTYHGPGQLVAYPIVDLRALGTDVPGYVALLERAMIAALGEHGCEAQLLSGLTGVWSAGRPPIAPGELGPEGTVVAGGGAASRDRPARKIGSIGIHVSRGIATHGLAVNVGGDLTPFEWVVPCGIERVPVTSLSRELGTESPVGAFAETICRALCAELGADERPIAPGELSRLLAGAGR